MSVTVTRTVCDAIGDGNYNGEILVVDATQLFPDALVSVKSPTQPDKFGKILSIVGPKLQIINHLTQVPLDLEAYKSLDGATVVMEAQTITTQSEPASRTINSDLSVAGDLSTDSNLTVDGTSLLTGDASLAGDIKLDATGGNAQCGNATLVAGVSSAVTVSTTKAKTASVIMLTRKTLGSGTAGILSYTISNGVSFTIASDEPTDNGIVSWVILNTI